MPRFWFHHCASIPAEPISRTSAEVTPPDADDDDACYISSSGKPCHGHAQDPEEEVEEEEEEEGAVSVSLNAFGSGPLCMLWPGIPRMLFSYLHALGLYRSGPGQCVCCCETIT